MKVSQTTILGVLALGLLSSRTGLTGSRRIPEEKPQPTLPEPVYMRIVLRPEVVGFIEDQFDAAGHFLKQFHQGFNVGFVLDEFHEEALKVLYLFFEARYESILIFVVFLNFIGFFF